MRVMSKVAFKEYHTLVWQCYLFLALALMPYYVLNKCQRLSTMTATLDIYDTCMCKQNLAILIHTDRIPCPLLLR